MQWKTRCTEMSKYEYQNYHCHREFTNVRISDSVVKNTDYAARAVNLGHSILSSCEHGWQGNPWNNYKAAMEYGLKPLMAAEAYWVKDRTEKDKSNCHIWLGAKNENGRRAITRILSEANLTGFYGQARIDVPLLLSLPKDDVWCTTACVAYWKYDDIDEITKELAEHFRNNFYLEVQYHNTEKQIELNRKILKLRDKLHIPLIMGCDSHYIFEEQNKARKDFLVSKEIIYPDEDGWYLDYPTGEEAYRRFAEQCVLNDSLINEAMSNTNIFKDVEAYDEKLFDKSIKLPSYRIGWTPEQKNAELRKIVYDSFEDYKKDISTDNVDYYTEQIESELKVIEDTGMADYFLINHDVIKQGKMNGGHLTKSGRGCFTKDALVHTSKTMKPISEVKIGDYVIDMNGQFKKVLNTMSYHIKEDMIKIDYAYGCGKKFPNICTKDHKILINRNGNIEWVKAENLIVGDYVCLPKIHFNDSKESVIDLNDYNVFGYDFDDEYIYEYSPYINNKYDYSPTELAGVLGVGKSVVEKIANGIYSGKNKLKNESLLLKHVPFSTIDEYRDYIKQKRTKKIRRYIKIDYLLGQFIGLLYGDGVNRCDKNDISLAINSQNHKNTINRKIFETISSRLNLSVYENVSKNRNLIQLYIRSKLVSEFIKNYAFSSKKGQAKSFNESLFYTNKEFRAGLISGLDLSDGSNSDTNYKRHSFDNTSYSLVNAYKVLKMEENNSVGSIIFRESGIDNRGYNRKDSIKLRYSNSIFTCQKKALRCKMDDKYLYSPINKIETIKDMETDVFDLTVEGSHSYLLGNMVVHNSAVSFFVNKLLGFTEVDRIAASVKMYPERFMSTTRILQSGSLPDIDFNCGNVEPFALAQKQVLGEDHAYPMIAYGTMKTSKAFKLYAKACDIPFVTANVVSNQIQAYEKAVKKAEDEEEIRIEDYIEKQYLELLEESKEYLGLVDSWSIAPCSYLLYDGNISEEIGLVRIKGNLCCIMDGKWAEECHFLKNDLLKVSVVELIYKAFENIGREPMTVNELLKECTPTDSAWKMYERGAVQGLNQVERNGTRQRVMKYKPTNISELCAFVAAIRPGFKSMYDIFASRKPFSYGVKSFDSLLQTPEMPNSFCLYQEQEMSVLNFAGIDMSDCYTAIKNIAKKRVDKVLAYKEKFIDGFSQGMIRDEGRTPEEAEELAGKLWQIIEDSSAYSFNASHSYCVSLDSLYCAWLKSHYPLEFYAAKLALDDKEDKKDKFALAKEEAEEYFSIKFLPFKYGQDNRAISVDRNQNAICKTLSSIKGYGENISELLFQCSNEENKTWYDVIAFCYKNSLKMSKLEPLVKIGFFSEFGSEPYLLFLLRFYDLTEGGTKKKIKKESKKSKIDDMVLYMLKELWIDTDGEWIKLTEFDGDILKAAEDWASRWNMEWDLKQKADAQNEILGYIDMATGKKEDRKSLYVTGVTELPDRFKGGIWKYKIGVKSFGTGKNATLDVVPSLFKAFPIKQGDILKNCEVSKNRKGYWDMYKYEVVTC